MKYTFFLVVLFLMLSCEKNENFYNFLDLDDRIGPWVNIEFHDTLNFLTDSMLIISRPGSKSTLFYNIKDSIMYLSPNKSYDTRSTHGIINIGNGNVTLSRMYSAPANHESKLLYIKLLY